MTNTAHPGRALVSGALLLLLFTLAMLSPLSLADSDTDLSTDEAHFVTWKRRGIPDTFYTTAATNDSAVWTSTARPFGSVSVFLIGEGLNYSLTDAMGNYTRNGTTNASLSGWSIQISPNASIVWPILEIFRANATGNGTVSDLVNFGQMVVGRETVSVVEEVLPDSVLADVAAKLVWWSVLSTVGLMAIWLLLAYLLVSAMKRGRVISD